jgi:hypothetical protein
MLHAADICSQLSVLSAQPCSVGNISQFGSYIGNLALANTLEAMQQLGAMVQLST